MPNLTPLIQDNGRRWAKMKITRGAEMDRVASRLVASGAKSRYVDLQTATGVPWFVIAVIHEREASQNFLANLAQGDPFDRVSTHVPKGRGPFPSFKAAAIDALTNCEPYAAKWKDWSPGGALTLLEQYNGLGYSKHGMPSPYVWSGTDQYTKGKYVADGVFDPNVVDKQLGCAGLIKAMMALDPTITFTGAVIIPPPRPPDPLKPVPQPVQPQPSKWAAFFTAIASIFRRTP